MKKLSKLQAELLAMIGTTWAAAPLGVKSVTLLSLRDRGVIQMRYNPAFRIYVCLSYSSITYQWRRTP